MTDMDITRLIALIGFAILIGSRALAGVRGRTLPYTAFWLGLLVLLVWLYQVFHDTGNEASDPPPDQLVKTDITAPNAQPTTALFRISE